MTTLSTDEIKEAVRALDYKALGRVAYGEKVREMERQWREYLHEAHFPAGTTDEQFMAVYRYAWQEGHAYGYGEVESHLIEMLDVVLRWERAGQ